MSEPAAEVASEPVQELPAEDVLELTEEVKPEPAFEPEPAPESLSADEVIFASIEDEAPPAEPVVAEAPEDEGIFSDKTRQALDEAFAGIEPDEIEPADEAAPLPAVDGASVEAVFDRAVREAFDPVLRAWLGEHSDAIIERMKPVIREWMDEHFPEMLEEAVRSEVARVARGRRR